MIEKAPQTPMLARKRTFSNMNSETWPQSESRTMSIFEAAREELDEHHDRRERVVKASRDITASSKKIIFALQRVRTLGEPVHGSILSKTNPLYENIKKSFVSVLPDLQSSNAHRYSRNITGGIQEYMEAVLFQHYLENQSILSYEDARDQLNRIGGNEPGIHLTVNDYLLGLLDMTGELMRFSITSNATSNGPSVTSNTNVESPLSPRSALHDLRKLRSYFEAFDAGSDHGFSKDMNQKLQVLQNSVQKVERNYYDLTVRGSERPAGWVPEASDRQEEVMSY